MFRFDFSLYNPFNPGSQGQKDYVLIDKKLTEFKHFEMQITKWSPDRLFSISVDTHWYGTSHGGVGFDIEVLGYFFAAKIYDYRHWDHENHCWEKYND